MFAEEETQKRAQVAPATSSTDTDKIAPISDQVFSDALFEEKTRQYVQKYLARWFFPASMYVEIVVVSKEEMPKKEAEISWDLTGILYACLRIRRDIPERLHERLVAHEILELLGRHEADAIHTMARYIDDPLKTELLLAYYRAHNETIENALAALFGEPRKDHLLYNEEQAAARQSSSLLSLPVTPIPEATSPYIENAISFRKLMEQWNQDDVEEEEEEEDNSWLLGDTSKEDEPYSFEHPAIRIETEGLGEKCAPVEEIVPLPAPEEEVVEEVVEEKGCLLDDMSEEDMTILAHLHTLGANQTASFFADKTHLVLPVTSVPMADPVSEVHLPSQRLTLPSQQAKSPFSRPRLAPLTPEQEQNQVWALETIQTPSVSLPVIKKQPQNEAQMDKKSGKSAWEALIRLARKG